MTPPPHLRTRFKKQITAECLFFSILPYAFTSVNHEKRPMQSFCLSGPKIVIIIEEEKSPDNKIESKRDRFQTRVKTSPMNRVFLYWYI